MLTFFAIIAAVIIVKLKDPFMPLYLFVLIGLFMIFCYLTGGKPGSKPWGQK